MSENVIEQRIKEWLRAEEIYDVGEVGVAYGDCARELQAATRPEQFMPRLDEWPEWANWATNDFECRISFFEYEPELTSGKRYWSQPKGIEGVGREIVPPLGIDPRIKVSREQMAAWEANQS